MTGTPRRGNGWLAFLVPLAVALITGSYMYTWLETKGIVSRLTRMEGWQIRILCKIDPTECLRDGGPRQ